MTSEAVAGLRCLEHHHYHHHFELNLWLPPETDENFIINHLNDDELPNSGINRNPIQFLSPLLQLFTHRAITFNCCRH
uniref:Uncharacterized protein n=1 Tax=Glossina pallidipes TaxID=7398 RepID=A0A1B0ABX5_GLOPL